MNTSKLFLSQKIFVSQETKLKLPYKVERIVACLFLGDFLALILAHSLSYLSIHWEFQLLSLPLFPSFINLTFWAALLSLGLSWMTSIQKRSLEHPLIVNLKSMALVLILMALLESSGWFFLKGIFFHPTDRFHQALMPISWTMSLLCLFLARFSLGRLFKYTKWGLFQASLLGHSPVTQKIWENREHFKAFGLEILNTLSLSEIDLENDLKNTKVNALFIAESELTPPIYDQLRHLTMNNKYSVYIAPKSWTHYNTQKLLGLNDNPFYRITPPPLSFALHRFFKRSLDLLIALGSLFFLWPLFILIGLAIKRDSVGPIFYQQTRVSHKGKNFEMLKFRTMGSQAEQDSGPVWARTNDQRVTRIGNFLRRSSLDELPQLLNVLKGDMSFVGPRPERPFFVDKFSAEMPFYADRHLVKSGMTGWSQVNGLRGDTSLEERLQHDLHYIKNWSLYFDFKIIFLSFYTVIYDYIYKRAY